MNSKEFHSGFPASPEPLNNTMTPLRSRVLRVYANFLRVRANVAKKTRAARIEHQHLVELQAFGFLYIINKMQIY